MPATPPSRALAAALYGGTTVAALAAPSLVDAVARRVGRRLPRAAVEFGVTGAIVGAGFAAVAFVERRRPHRDDWNRADGSEITDLLHLVVGGSAALVAGSALTSPIRSRLRATNGGRLLATLPLPVRLAVTLVVSDLYHSSLHRFVHTWEPLWKVHSVHHSARRLYSFNAGRFHTIQATLVVAGDNVVLAALGLDPRTAVSHRVFRAIFGQIQHSNASIDSGALNAVLSTPERHRWHHSTSVRESNTNFGDVVCIWDRLFGTDYLPEDREMDGQLGIGGMPDYPQDFRGQCEAPFRWDQLSATAGR